MWTLRVVQVEISTISNALFTVGTAHLNFLSNTRLNELANLLFCNFVTTAVQFNLAYYFSDTKRGIFCPDFTCRCPEHHAVRFEILLS
ncbi:hypothetical protein GMA8713_03343 [Grimontia marina]|uniref:Uncharacterized protein n=1 Tax=Grimontia marina TaxID=646534 RepID=A0A128FDZ2_9GAMM|nr:hypothetical protein GMA8713_03343 [Grimontia marina]